MPSEWLFPLDSIAQHAAAVPRTPNQGLLSICEFRVVHTNQHALEFDVARCLSLNEIQNIWVSWPIIYLREEDTAPGPFQSEDLVSESTQKWDRYAII